MFESDTKYEHFRATFKIWIPSLYTLDGTDFKNDFEAIVNAYIFMKTFLESEVARSREE